MDFRASPPRALTYKTSTSAPSAQTHSSGRRKNNHTLSGDFGETTRVIYTALGPISKLQLFLPNQTGASGHESNLANPVFYFATVEYPLGQNSSPPSFTLNGQTRMQVGVTGSGVLTDVLGVSIPAGAQFAIRFGTYVAWQPASASLAVSAGGALAASTTYYYKFTSLIGGVESGPTAEYSATTTASNLTITATITPTVSPLGYDAIKVYRSTISGAEVYLGQIPYPGVTFVDSGLVPTVTGATPPYSSYCTYTFDSSVGSNMSTNSLIASGNGANVAIGSGALYAVGPNSTTVSTPNLLGDDVASFPVCGLGDSIEAGSNILNANQALGNATTNASWFGAALPQGTFNSFNLSLPTGTLQTIVGLAASGNLGASLRLRSLDFCSYVWSNLGTNDIVALGLTWQTVAANHLQVAKSMFLRGKRYYITTLLPRVSTTDNMITLSGQAVLATEAVRVNYNNWVYGGTQVDGSGNPVLSGGTASPYIAGYFDICAALGEVNSSGTATRNGGYWPVPASAAQTGQTLTGTPTTTALTVGAAAYTVHGLAGMVVKMTSGAALNSTSIIKDNTATGLTLTTALSATPAAGDTFSIYNTIGSDGTHPTLTGHTLIAAGANGAQGSIAFAAANFKGF